MTVSLPCALVASATLTTLSATNHGPKNGVLFKDGAAMMKELSRMDVLFSDKTSNLMPGAFEVDPRSRDSRSHL